MASAWYVPCSPPLLVPSLQDSCPILQIREKFGVWERGASLRVFKSLIWVEGVGTERGKLHFLHCYREENVVEVGCSVGACLFSPGSWKPPVPQRLPCQFGLGNWCGKACFFLRWGAGFFPHPLASPPSTLCSLLPWGSRSPPGLWVPLWCLGDPRVSPRCVPPLRRTPLQLKRLIFLFPRQYLGVARARGIQSRQLPKFSARQAPDKSGFHFSPHDTCRLRFAGQRCFPLLWPRTRTTFAFNISDALFGTQKSLFYRKSSVFGSIF